MSFASTLLLAVVLLQATAARLKHEVSAAPGVTGATASNPAGPKQNITFAQITDAHIFDDGWKAKGSDPYTQAMDNRAALHWAVESINELAAKSRIDFVVYSGDFGLQNVFFLDPACSKVPFKSEPGLAPFTAELAVAEAAIEFDRLKVPDLYVVAGNNDIIDEQVEDYPRFECFVAQLQANLQKLPGNIHVEILRADKTVSVGSLRLAGLNTASFKEAVKYTKACSPGSKPAAKALDQSCPAPQIKEIHGLLNGSDASPVLLFTHVPDLIDPYKNVSSWNLDRTTQDEWLQEASDLRLVGVFAGHFHSNLTKLYATNSGTKELFVDARDGEKTWVTPPLAGKNQRDGKPQARGFMLVKVDASGSKVAVTATPVWYESPTPVGNGERKMSQQCFFLIVVLVIFIAGCFGGVLNFLLNQKPTSKDPGPDSAEVAAEDEDEDEDEPGLLANLVLGVGAAFLVPLFLHAIGSNLVDDMHHGADGQPDYSKVLVFAGFCLVASMSAKSFISSVSDRVLKKAEDAKKLAEEAKQQAAKAQATVARMVDSSGGHAGPRHSDPRAGDPEPPPR